ncbi:MAG: DUF896 domain-containing protein [Oscillospiraceae bacterium]|nr:DUF896 domain-containing protein [Oscillospiraceae bacterium]
MEQKKLDRINFLARKSRTEELTPAEKEEQAALRQEYRDSFVRSLSSQLENTYIVNPDGSKKKVSRRNGGDLNE